MSFRKHIIVQNINPRTIFTILIFFITVWLLSKPLKSLGLNTYLVIGSAVNNLIESTHYGKEKIKDLITSSNLIEKQSKNISVLKMKINFLEDELLEVNNLKNLLTLQNKINYKTNVCKVIGRTSDNWHKQIIIDKGLHYNIMMGDSVLTYSGVVGQIVDVNKHTSIVQLTSDPSYKVGSKISKKNIFGIFSGKTSRIGLLEFIPVGTNIILGDIVVTSGLQSKDLPPSYPAGHPIGKVIKVSKKKKKASDLYIEVKLFEDLTSLSNVLVFSPT